MPFRRFHHLALLFLLLLAFALRLPSPERALPGLYRDEAYYGLDAAQVLAGHPRLYFPANNGREPLFIYLVAAFEAILGRTPAAVRLPSAFVGTVFVAAIYALGAALFRPRVGWAAAALVAVTPWPIMLSRVGFRAGLLPLLMALAATATLCGLSRNERRWVAWGGVLSGLTLYTYVASWLAWLVPLLVLLPAVRRRRTTLSARRARTSAATLWLTAGMATAMPLLFVLAAQPVGPWSRARQVFVTGADRGLALTALAGNVRSTALMFHRRGDSIPRHNIPGRPVFAPPAGFLALVGVVWCVLGLRQRTPARLLLAWLGVMLLPTVLAADAPHFLRASGALPAAMLLPALGSDVLATRLSGRQGRIRSQSAPLFFGLVLVAAGAELRDTWRDDQRRSEPPRAEELYFAFESGASDLSRDLNGVLAAGWQGGWGTEPARSGGRAVWLDRRLRDGWAAVPFLAADPEVARGGPVPRDRSPAGHVTLCDPHDPVLTTGDGVAYLWPYDVAGDAVWSALPKGIRLAFQPGAQERGDLESEARQLYVRVEARPVEKSQSVPQRPWVARFANGLVLYEAQAWLEPSGFKEGSAALVGRGGADQEPGGGPDAPAAGLIRLESVWGVERPTGASLRLVSHLVAEGRTVAVHHVELGPPLYPLSRWRVGDRVSQMVDFVPPSRVPARGLQVGLGLADENLGVVTARVHGRSDELREVLVDVRSPDTRSQPSERRSPPSASSQRAPVTGS